MPGGSRQRTLHFLSHPPLCRFPLRSVLWQYSIRVSLLQMRSLSTRPSWSLRLNICYVTAQFMSPSSLSYVPILLWTATHLSTCTTHNLPSRKGPVIWVSIWLQVDFHISANLRASSQHGKQPRLWLRPNSRQMQWRGHMVFLLPSYRVIGTSIMTEFKNKFGHHISDDRLPAQSMFESFTEKLADGTLKAEPLSLVVSLFEEEQQDAKKPDHSRQHNLQLDSRLTITTKRRHQSTEPTDEKGLRLKYAILTNLWLLGQNASAGQVYLSGFQSYYFQ